MKGYSDADGDAGRKVGVHERVVVLQQAGQAAGRQVVARRWLPPNEAAEVRLAKAARQRWI
jgi:hypothetical protein